MAAACLSCLECGNGVLCLLGVRAGCDELLFQRAVLQERGKHPLMVEVMVPMVEACASAKAVHSKVLPGWLCADE